MDTKAEILKKLNNSFDEVSTWLEAHEDTRFVLGPEGKWNTSGHLDHLKKTAELVTKGLRMPKLALRWKFGKPNREIRTYDEVVTRYQEKLKNIPPGVTSPIEISDFTVDNKSACIRDYKKAGHKLSAQIKKWPDQKLDAYLLPHPLMGRMPIRELLMWTDYHNYHHLKILKEKY